MPVKHLTIKETWAFRAIERRAFAWCFLAFSMGYLAFFLSGDSTRRASLDQLFPLGIFGLSLAVIHLTLVMSRYRGDPGLVIPTLFLAGLGLMAQFRMGLFDFEDPWRLSHFAYPLGIVVMLTTVVLFKRDRYQGLKFFWWISGLGALGVVAALVATGTQFRGAVYASGNRTPTEFIKILAVVFLAGYLARRTESGKRDRGSTFLFLLPIAIFFAALVPLLLWQRDLGMIVNLAGLLVVLIFVATGRWSYLVAASVVGVGAAFAAFKLFLHGQQRFRVWFDPFFDPTGASWQLLQGLSGMFSGGLWGAGFGKGNPERIPIAASDFIYAVIGEELGYFGCLLVVTLFVGFFHRAYRVAKHTENPFGALLSVGLTTMIMIQTFLNIGGVTKTVPLTGIPLPFISHGGSSLITMFCCLGLLLAVSDGVEPLIESSTAAGKRAKRGHSR